MAAAEHLSLVRQGPLAIGRWRERYPHQRLDLRDADLCAARLEGADLSGADLRGATLEEASLERARLRDADLRGAELCQVHLAHADLTRADLGQASLPCADLYRAVLVEANLGDANLEEADLCCADLTFADLRAANLRGTRLDDARLWHTGLASLDLSRARGLETAHHLGPSDVGFSTLVASRGRIPRAFLRGTGIPDNLIDGLLDLLAGARLPPTCLLACAESDEDFARRLQGDLERSGRRVWRWREDPRIARAVHEHDRVFVICGPDSAESPALEQVIAHARLEEQERERRGRDSTVLVSVESETREPAPLPSLPKERRFSAPRAAAGPTRTPVLDPSCSPGRGSGR